MSSYLVILKEIITILGPLIAEFLKSIKDKEIRNIKYAQANAKTLEEKRDAARKIADYLYRN